MKKYTAYAKVNIFLKITGMRENYHEILSRFVLVNNLYDELYFTAKESEKFEIIGDFSCNTEQNTIHKAYIALQESIQSSALERLMKTHAINVDKRIPAFAGLGGGSSDAATYLKMCNEVLHLGLSVDELAIIGLKVGADVPFFIYGYQSANVSGIGEIVEAYEEESLEIQTTTPDIEISTPKVYQAFRENFYKELHSDEALELREMPSKEILARYDIERANDLFTPALQLYPRLKEAYTHGWYFSGSGSSYFKVEGL